ncbi:MAG: AAA family ATPase [Selenomonadaceae bacterium]|nr:AAA family ATPase [Selenomonadaceae bacterium]
MGIYLNPGDELFWQAAHSEIYVDKTGLLNYTNKVLRTNQKYLCVSRPRRFGKSMAANMVAAYYDRTVDASSTFAGLAIRQSDDFETYRNKYDVIQLNMQNFLSRTHDMQAFLQRLKKSILWDVLEEYPDYRYFDSEDLIRTLSDVHRQTERPFVIIIDEWDCVFREYRDNNEWQKLYLDFLRDWLKDNSSIALVYMTGILPIKKYGTHSALNMFREFSMEDPLELAPYVGFTSEEVQTLCRRYERSFEECQRWYDGYSFQEVGEVYNPHSVVRAISSGRFDTYWNQTETYEALKIYITMNFDGLRDSILKLLAGERQMINTKTFSNDMTSFHSADDVLTLLVHLGYLGYDSSTEEVFIPNQEIAREYYNAITTTDWDIVARALKQSEKLLQAVLAKDEEAVAKGIEEAHMETSHIQYNDENALSYTLSLAFYSARQKYKIFRELPTGKGFADIVFLPRPLHAELPALVLELKWDKNAKAAIQQIRDRRYGKALENYAGKLLAVGICYDKETRKHECLMEEYDMP